jgi:general secretion pathway protein I
VRSPIRKPGQAGFSLIEVLVALAIGGLALTAIAGVVGDGIAGDRTSVAATTALTLAEAKIASAGTAEKLRPGTTQGTFAGRFEWLLRITRYEDREPDAAADLGQPASPLQLYRIEAAIQWREGMRQRRLTLATLRLAAGSP